MLKNYLQVGYRNLRNNKVFSLINLSGLTLGITSFLILLQYVSFELSYDKFHDNASDIYRVRLDSYKGGIFESSSAISFYGESPAIKESFPQVINFVRLHRADGMLNYYDEKGTLVSYFEQSGLYADSSFFSVFSFPLVKGDKNSVMRKPNSMVLSESAAKKYFGSSDPIGKVLKLKTGWEGGEFVVEGVFKDIPSNSHLKFDFLFAIEKLLHNNQFLFGAWYWTNFYNYLLLKPGTDAKQLETALGSIIEKRLGKDLKATNSNLKFVLQPVTDIHLHSNIFSELTVNGDYKLVYFLMIVAFLIMGIAWLNYLNISTAKAIERAKEVGIRKVLGSEKHQLVKQFLIESFLLSTTAMMAAGILLVIVRPYFTELLGHDFTVAGSSQINFWVVIGVFMILGTFLSSIYPALILSSFLPLNALKGKSVGNVSGAKMRNVMVVFQFTGSIVLIIATLTVGRQLKFMKEMDLGMNTARKVIVRAPKIVQGESMMNEIDRFKRQLTQFPAIGKVASSSEVPGKEIFWTNEFQLKQEEESEKKVLSVLSVDEDFIATYDVKLIAGRNFSKANPSDFGEAVILNETALTLLGFPNAESAIDQEFAGFPAKKIIGVIKDFRQQSFQKSIAPIILFFIPWGNDYITVTIDSKDVRSGVNIVTETYKKVFPENAIEFFFLDDFFEKQYKSEDQFWRIFIVFSILALFIACIGLFGLSSLSISKRTKEIGIRKVLGSSVMNITALLLKDFMRLVLIAFFLAIPVGTLFINKWLEGFANRISISPWIYLVALAIALTIALITVSFLTLRAALANPVKSIRLE